MGMISIVVMFTPIPIIYWGFSHSSVPIQYKLVFDMKPVDTDDSLRQTMSGSVETSVFN